LTSAVSLAKEAVIERVKKANFWAIIADETTDKFKREQMVVVIRYVMKDEHGHWQCREDPIAIFDVFGEIKDETERLSTESEIRLSGANISSTLLRVLTSNVLSLEHGVGQGYDGATSMASDRVGVVAHFKQSAEHAHYFHCAMHRLNLIVLPVLLITQISATLLMLSKIYHRFSSQVQNVQRFFKIALKVQMTRISQKQN